MGISLSLFFFIFDSALFHVGEVCWVGVRSIAFFPSSVKAIVGDVITFKFVAPHHNVVVYEGPATISYPSGSVRGCSWKDCSKEDITGNAVGSTWDYVVTTKDAGIGLTFYCVIHAPDMSGTLHVDSYSYAPSPESSSGTLSGIYVLSLFISLIIISW